MCPDYSLFTICVTNRMDADSKGISITATDEKENFDQAPAVQARYWKRRIRHFNIIALWTVNIFLLSVNIFCSASTPRPTEEKNNNSPKLTIISQPVAGKADVHDDSIFGSVVSDGDRPRRPSFGAVSANSNNSMSICNYLYTAPSASWRSESHIEVYEHEIQGKLYFIENEVDGNIYARAGVDEPGDRVGQFVNSIPEFIWADSSATPSVLSKYC